MKISERLMGVSRPRLRAVALFLILIGALAGSSVGSSGAAAARSSNPQTAHTPITLQWNQGTNSSFLVYVAYRQGFFYRDGLDATLLSISGSTLGLAAIEGGSVAAGLLTPENVFVAEAKGLALTAITSETLTTGFFQFVASNSVQDLPGTLQQKLQALKGKTIGVTGLGSAVQILTEEIMSSAGLQYPADYSFAVVAGGAPVLAALESNKIQADMATEPVPAEVVADHAGFVIDPLTAVTHQFPKQITSGLPYGDIWSLSSWVSSHKTQVKAIQKAIAQAYVWAHDPKHFTTAESYALDMYGGSNIPTGELSALTTIAIQHSAAWVSRSAIAPFDLFDKQFGFIPSIIPTNSMVTTYGPTSEAAAIALAAS